MKKFFGYFTLFEKILWLCSVAVIIAVFVAFRNTEYHYLIGSLVGVTALIFNAKGNPTGPVLIVVFSVFYGVISWSFRYYGEMITYLCMSAPISVLSFVSWLKNPYKGKRSEVSIGRIGRKDILVVALLGIAVTVGFYFLLGAFHTNHLVVSTLSVLTSFVASALMVRRSRFFAAAYAVNDAVLILLWSLASAEDIRYLSMVVCFVAFLVSDAYSFISWTKMQRKQFQTESGITG